ncbi:DNA processing protein DprA [Alphaproteobacteria bacterium]|nr:DNA processing protein DprA [Alphaproteobacteria bacterium]GHS99029.1 DNA processing protein DprA [Alphaproteobacteria bacterium]
MASEIENVTPQKQAEEEFLEHEKRGFTLLAAYEAAFPEMLRDLRDCPMLLSAAGDISLLNKPSLAFVGARNASLLGKMFTTKMAQSLGQKGWVIISGLARGIDTAAHIGSLETGSLAVLACGLDVIYPPENAALYKNIIANGLVLSEMPLGTSVEPSLFPRRNRIIAGLARGVVLVEAAQQSGSLITAHYAVQEGKDVFAVPGFPSDPRSQGCNALIKQGAVLVESADDVLAFLSPLESTSEIPKGDPKGMGGAADKANALREEILETERKDSLKDSLLRELSLTPVSVETLFQTQNCSLPHLLQLICELEMSGVISRFPNGDIALQAKL